MQIVGTVFTYYSHTISSIQKKYRVYYDYNCDSVLFIAQKDELIKERWEPDRRHRRDLSNTLLLLEENKCLIWICWIWQVWLQKSRGCQEKLIFYLFIFSFLDDMWLRAVTENLYNMSAGKKKRMFVETFGLKVPDVWNFTFWWKNDKKHHSRVDGRLNRHKNHS